MEQKNIKEVFMDTANETYLLFKDSEIKKKDTETINLLQNIIDELSGKGLSGKKYVEYDYNELSQFAGSIALLRITLGEIISRAYRNLQLAEEYRQFKKSAIRQPIRSAYEEKKIKITQKDLEAEIKKQTLSDNLIEIYNKEFYEKANNLWWASETLLKTIEYRITILQKENSKSKWFDDHLNIDFDQK